MASAPRTPTALRLLATARRRPSPYTLLARAPLASPRPRHLHASAARAAVGDGSTIDFAFLPAMEYFPVEERAAWMRIPVEPDATVMAPAVVVGSGAAETIPVDEPTLRPEINLISADGTHINAPSAMSEVHDNTSVDFEGTHDAGPNGGSHAPVEGDATIVGAMRQLWGDLLDDLAGTKAKS